MENIRNSWGDPDAMVKAFESAMVAVREAAERVRSAILASGFEFPRNRVVISLAPADIRKEGTGFDLPMAMAILAAAGVVDRARAARWLFAGELALSGEVRGVRGALSIACVARDAGFEGVVLPAASAAEGALVEGVDVRVAGTLREVVQFIRGEGELLRPGCPESAPPAEGVDLREVEGQTEARLAREVAAACPRPCGYHGHPSRACVCSPSARQRYRAHLSGPIVDRIELRVVLVPVDPALLFGSSGAEDSASVRVRVEAARVRQRARNGPGLTNASVAAERVVSLADPSEVSLRALVSHVERSGTSARVARRILRVSRTLADLEGTPRVELRHVERAITLRFEGEEQVAP